jgi:large subunit ribosomal protein L18
MRAVKSPSTRRELRARRHLRVRKKIAGTADRPRLVVFRSLKHIYVQLVDDDRGVTLLGVSDGSEGVTPGGAGKVGKAKGTGKALAARAKAAGITKVVFDRAGYRYHGRVKAIAEGAREGGLEF